MGPTCRWKRIISTNLKELHLYLKYMQNWNTPDSVHAPRRFTMLGWWPTWVSILSSDMRASFSTDSCFSAGWSTGSETETTSVPLCAALWDQTLTFQHLDSHLLGDSRLDDAMSCCLNHHAKSSRTKFVPWRGQRTPLGTKMFYTLCDELGPRKQNSEIYNLNSVLSCFCSIWKFQQHIIFSFLPFWFRELINGHTRFIAIIMLSFQRYLWYFCCWKSIIFLLNLSYSSI